MEETTLQKLEQLRAENRDTKQLLLNVVSILQTEKTIQSDTPFPVFKYIPIQNHDDFKQLEDIIKHDHGSYSQLV